MDFTPRILFGTAAALLLAFAFVAAWAERRRARRQNLDRPGLVPWQLLEVLAFMLAVIAAILAVKL